MRRRATASGRTGRAVPGLLTVLAVVLLAWFPSPAAVASVASPRVIAVHTGSGSEVSMVLETAALPSSADLSSDELSVTVGGRPVPTRITPLASNSLSVVLVIDTSGGMAPDELEAVQSGATEFLLRLPAGAQSAVVASGGSARLVAPLGSGPGAALSAVSALRTGGDRSTGAGALLAARELAAARPGPREIVVFTSGVDRGDPSVEQLSDDLIRTGVVTSVVQTQPVDYWTRVVDRAGGAVMTTSTDQVVSSFEELATALEDQFLVSFDAPVARPAVAAVGVGVGDAAMTTLVRLPDPAAADASGVATTSVGDQLAGPVSALAIVLLLAGLLGLVLLRRTRRRASSAPTPTPSAPAPSIPAPSAPAPSTASETAMPPQVSIPVFARGRREASGSPPLASLLSRPAPGESPARSAVRLRPITLRGHGDGVVTLRKKDPGPTVVHITGNDAARFFGVRTLGSETDLLNTIDPYDGVRALDWEGRETTGFEVQATGAWTIEVLPVAAIPTIDSSFDGSGDMVLRCTGTGSTAKIVGNDAGRYFTVRVLGDHLPVRVVNATESYSGTFSIPDGHRLIAIEAVGPWTLSVT